MSANNHRQIIEETLQELQDELTRLGYWQGALINPERTNSTEPFCADTLSLPEWLQWVFIPRMRTVIRNDIALPFPCDISPRVEIWTMESPKISKGLILDITRRADELISRYYVTPQD